ncbi:MAG: HAMP domain-containing sensor histidine kinase [Saprospiraceae bacterium]
MRNRLYFCTMVKPQKDWLPLALMLVSVLLLLVSQSIWLQRTYRSERQSFAKRTGELLDASVRKLYDASTMMQLQKELGEMDSSLLQIRIGRDLPPHHWNYSTHAIDDQPGAGYPGKITMSMGLDSMAIAPSDSGEVKAIVFAQYSEVGMDSIPHTRKLFRQTQHTTDIRNILTNAEWAPKGLQVLLNLANDSLSVDSVRQTYALQLKQENIDVPFLLLPADSNLVVGNKGLSTPSISVNMFGNQGFQAHFPSYRTYLLGRMWEELLFSILVLGMVILAFIFIYRNLLKQRRLGQMKNELLSNITHELKTPISSVSVAIEAMRDFGVLKDPALAREYLDISQEELSRLSLLVDRVLRLTTFEQKEPDLHFERVDMAEVSQNIMRTMRVQFDQYDGRGELELDGTDFSMHGDRTHLSAVLFNLLDNALKYRNGRHPSVKLRLEDQSNSLRISVEDNGIGIHGDYQKKIFEKFFRVPKGNIHNTKGYGLGLSYVAAVVEKHGGDIAVKSKVGEGSTFILTLPK